MCRTGQMVKKLNKKNKNVCWCDDKCEGEIRRQGVWLLAGESLPGRGGGVGGREGGEWAGVE